MSQINLIEPLAPGPDILGKSYERTSISNDQEINLLDAIKDIAGIRKFPCCLVKSDGQARDIARRSRRSVSRLTSMRHIASLLVFVLTLTGLAHVHAHAAGVGSEGQSQAPILSMLLVEQAGRTDTRYDPEPSASADAAAFCLAAALFAAPKCFGTKCRAEYSISKRRSHPSQNFARAPPRFS